MVEKINGNSSKLCMVILYIAMCGNKRKFEDNRAAISTLIAMFRVSSSISSLAAVGIILRIRIFSVIDQ